MSSSIRSYSPGYSWLVISLCSIFMFYKYVLQVSPSIMTYDLMQYFHLNGVGLGNLAAVFFYTFLITQLFAGPLLDKYSPRKLITVSIFFCALGAFIFATAKVLMIAAIGRAIAGAGAAFAVVGYMKMASIYFPPKQLALVTGFLATAAMIGAILGEAPLAYAVKLVGWQKSLFYVGIIGIFVAVLFYVIVRDKKHSAFITIHNKLEWKDCLTVLKKKENWLLALYSGFAFEPLDVFAGLWGNPFIQTAYHLTRTQTATYISFVFLGLAVGGPVLGWLSDQLNTRLRVMITGVIASLLCLTMVIYVSLPLWLLGVLLFLFGFSTGAFMLGFAMGAEINLPILAATIVALINTGDAILGAITEPFIGKLLDVFWNGSITNGVRNFSLSSFHEALSVLLIYLAAAFILLLFMKTKKT